jgi:hypothetical protein
MVDALKHLILLRLHAIGRHFAEFRQSSDGSQRLAPVVVRMYAPVNPLLLVSALALARVEKGDRGSFLSSYAGGLDVPGLEALIALEERLPQPEMLECLEIEDRYLDALVDLGLEELKKHGRVLGEQGEPSLLDVYWACWMVANPIYARDDLPVQKQLVRHDDATEAERARQWMRGFPRGVWWGMEHNSAIHNARERCEFRLNEANAALSDALERGEQEDLVASLARQQKTATMLVERARRLYYWAPHEIEAYDVSYRICTEMAQQRRKDGVADPWEGESGYEEYVAPFLLPSRMRDRLDLPEGNLP